ncbi:MAG: hypothetical protein IJU53_05150 [Thermoguttaceae bacterium]|nr:hypothetical protein [Thermoguttaceae bacterium]
MNDRIEVKKAYIDFYNELNTFNQDLVHMLNESYESFCGIPSVDQEMLEVFFQKFSLLNFKFLSKISGFVQIVSKELSLELNDY